MASLQDSYWVMDVFENMNHSDVVERGCRKIDLLDVAAHYVQAIPSTGDLYG
jgi:hypothetical protein